MNTTIGLLRQALTLHQQVRRAETRERRRKTNLEARSAVGVRERVGNAETMIMINGEPRSPSSLGER